MPRPRSLRNCWTRRQSSSSTELELSLTPIVLVVLIMFALFLVIEASLDCVATVVLLHHANRIQA